MFSAGRNGGLDSLGKLAELEEDGINGVDSWLSKQGTSFDNEFSDWIVANYVGSVEGVYSYSDWALAITAKESLIPWGGSRHQIPQYGARYFKIPPDKILVISDDLDLPAGKARLRDSGGHGGPNGLRSIMECLGTDKFLRARIGIGRPSTFDNGKQTSVTKHVLGKMEETKAELCLQAMGKVVEMLVRFVRYSHFQSTSISIQGPEISTTG